MQPNPPDTSPNHYINSTAQTFIPIDSESSTNKFPQKKELGNFTYCSLMAEKLKLAAALMAITSFALASMPAQALIPYTPRSIWDMMLPAEDPFRILEQSPLGLDIPKAAEALALARADWKETKTEHVITVEVPGIKRDEVKVEVDQENKVLKISGERKAEEEVSGDTWHRVERTAGKFWRQFRMPGNTDWERIEAGLENGVLRVVVPKLAEGEKKEPRVITIAGEAAGAGNVAGSVNVKEAKKDEM